MLNEVINFLNESQSQLPLDLLGVFPELFLFVVISTLLLVGSSYSTSVSNGYPIMVKPIAWLSLYSLFLTLLLNLNNPVNSELLFSGSLLLDDVTSFVKTVILISSAACLAVSLDYLKKERVHAFEFSVLILFTIVGTMLLISSYDLISFYLSIEMISLSSYVLASFKRQSAFSTESGLKYFLLGAFSSGLLLFGTALIYGITGSTNFGQIALFVAGLSELSLASSSGLITGVVFIGVALMFKITAAPFHMWAPDVYEGAPTIVSTFFAVVPKIAILGFLLRFLVTSFYDLADFWQQLIVFSSLSSMVIASLVALRQRKLKRFFAYSSVGHVGYLLIGCSTGTVEGITSMLIYTVIYIVMTLNAWTLILSLELESHGRGTYFTDLGYLSRINPLLAITFTMTLLSMAGVPPLAGFCAKMYVFFAAMEGSMYLLALIGVLTSVIGAFYYIRFIKIMYFEKLVSWSFFDQISREKSIILGATTLFILTFFLYPSTLMITAHQLALTLSI